MSLFNRSNRIALAGIMGMLILAGCLPRFERAAYTTPADELPLNSWIAVDLPLPAMASDGSGYELNFKRGSSNNLIVYFGGGGAAWDVESAAHPITIDSIMEAAETGSVTEVGYYIARLSRLTPLLMHGILEADRSDNPFNDWSILHLPYVTGDFHIGDRTANYPLEQGENLTVSYNGFNNVNAALDWLSGTGIAPERLLVAGQSAGGFASAIWFDRIASRYPEAELFQYSDSSFLYADDPMGVVNVEWGARLEDRFGFAAQSNVMDGALRFVLEKYGDRLTMLHSETVYDSVLPWYEARLNSREPDDAYRALWTERILTTYGALDAEYPNFYLYLTDYGLDDDGRTTHTLSQADSFFDTAESDISLAEWLADAVISSAPYDVGLNWLEPR